MHVVYILRAIKNNKMDDHLLFNLTRAMNKIKAEKEQIAHKLYA